MSSETVSAKSIYEELVSKKDALLDELCNTFQSSLSDESFPINYDTLSDLLDEALMVSFMNILIMKIEKREKYTASNYLKSFRKDLTKYNVKEYRKDQELTGESFDKYDWLKKLNENIKIIITAGDFVEEKITTDVNKSSSETHNYESEVANSFKQTNDIPLPDIEPFTMPTRTHSNNNKYNIFTLILADWITKNTLKEDHDADKFNFYALFNRSKSIVDTNHITPSFDKIKKCTNALNGIIYDLIELSKNSTEEGIAIFVLHFLALFRAESGNDMILNFKTALYIKEKGYSLSDIEKHDNNDMFMRLFAHPFFDMLNDTQEKNYGASDISKQYNNDMINHSYAYPHINCIENIEMTYSIRTLLAKALFSNLILAARLHHGIFNYDSQIPLLYSESCNPELIKLIDRLNCICRLDMTINVCRQYAGKKISLENSDYRYIAHRIKEHYINNNRLQSLIVDINDIKEFKDKKNFIWILSTIEDSEFRKFKAEIIPEINDKIKSKK